MIKWNLVTSLIGTIIVPLLYLINIKVILQTSESYSATYSLIILGTIISVLGLIMWVMSYINLGRSFGVLPQKQKRVKKGLYKYFNHPMYMAIYLTFLGMSIVNSSWQGLVFLNVVIVPLLFIRALFEEKKLY